MAFCLSVSSNPPDYCDIIIPDIEQQAYIISAKMNTQIETPEDVHVNQPETRLRQVSNPRLLEALDYFRIAIMIVVPFLCGGFFFWNRHELCQHERKSKVAMMILSSYSGYTANIAIQLEIDYKVTNELWNKAWKKTVNLLLAIFVAMVYTGVLTLVYEAR